MMKANPGPRGVGPSLIRVTAATLMVVASAATAHARQTSSDTSHSFPAAFQRHSLVPLPVIFYSPETRFGGGAALMHAYRTTAEGRPVATGASFIYTENRQVIVGAGTDAWFADARYHLSGSIGYTKFPNTFYGIGNATSDSLSEPFTPRTFAVDAMLDRRAWNDVYLGAGGIFADGSLVEVETGGLLASGQIQGSAGGRVAGVGVGLTYDTRDNILAATAGSLARFTARHHAAVFGSDYDFTALQLDLRRYRTVGKGHVLSAQAAWQGTTGAVPFDRLPRLGGQNLMRGYFEGRYRDRQFVAAQAEYRTPIWRRMGLVAFAGAGEVAPRMVDLTAGGIHFAAGGGFRVLLNRQERLALRMDFGAGAGKSGFYLTVGEAF